ncbi:unnamed protein product [Gadus morhua 'NCC']
MPRVPWNPHNALCISFACLTRVPEMRNELLVQRPVIAMAGTRDVTVRITYPPNIGTQPRIPLAAPGSPALSRVAHLAPNQAQVSAPGPPRRAPSVAPSREAPTRGPPVPVLVARVAWSRPLEMQPIYPMGTAGVRVRTPNRTTQCLEAGEG